MKKFAIEIKWAVIFAVCSLLWMILEKSFGLHDVHIDKHPIYTNFFAIVAITLYVLALRDKRKNYFSGSMDWKQGFVSGIILTAFIALLSPLTQYLTSTLITPDYFKNAIAYAVQHKVMSQENASAYYTLSSYVMQGIFGALSMGVVTAAVVAYFIKSK